ncbi:MAG: NAD(P)H-binding protein [Flavobacteriaceae bacterium]|nr:NAD(P)H-binding protein [Flavobacteriaceae bacterium]
MIDSNQIVVYGGTGFYGQKVVEKLVKKGQSIKVVTRNSENAKNIVGDKVVLFQGDVTEKGTIEKSLENVGAIVICLSAMSNKLIRRMKEIERDAVLEIMEQAKKANISRLVYMSGYEMRKQLLDDLKIPEFGEIKIEVEGKIRQSDFNWTILGDAPAFEMFFAFLNKGKMTVPGGGLNAFPTISPEDVGEITAQIVMREDLNERRIRLTGPKAYSFPEVAKLITDISGQRIKHMTIPLFLINIVSFLLLPFTPFVRFIYKSLKMLNNFPADLADNVPVDHKLLRELFDYEPVTLEMEINRRVNENSL